jgi:hypothetical protein
MEGDLSHVLLDRTDEVLASWSHRFDRSALRVPRPVDPRQHAAMVSTMVVALGETVTHSQPGTGADRKPARQGTIPPQRLRPGAAEVRELEKAASLAGASLSASGASGFDVAALVFALRDAVLEFASSEWAQAIGDLFEWLAVIAVDAFAAAGAASAQERATEHLETGTPVVLVTPEVPAVLFVGAPGGDALDSILARALLLVVRVGAPTLILDVSGLSDPGAPEVLEAAGRFFEQKRMREVEVALSGAHGPVGEAWIAAGRARGVTVTALDRFDAAVARALDRAGCQIVRRSR